MIRVVCLLLSIAAACSVSFAQPLDSVCRITVAHPGGSNQLTAWPFGSQQEGRGWRVFFMTNAHGFRETGSKRSVTVYPPASPPVECDSIDYLGDPDGQLDDLAVVSGVTANPPTLCELEQTDAAPGQPATLAGYPTDEGRLRTLNATRTAAVYTAGQVGFDAIARQGMSGGPVFSGDNRVCAMIASSGPGVGAICMPLRRIRQIIANVVERRRQLRQGHPVCIGPSCQIQPTPQQAMPRQTHPQTRPIPSPRPTDLAPMPRPALGSAIAPIAPTPQRLPQPSQQPIVSAETNPPAIDRDNQWVPATEPRQQPEPQRQPAVIEPPAIALTEPVHYQRTDTEPSATDQAIDWDDLAAKATVVICSITGVAIPSWLVIAWRGARGMRNIRRRRRRRIDQHTATPRNQPANQSQSQNPYAVPAAPPEPTVLLDQAPPAPQAIYKQTKFANVESDSFQHAYDWARREAVDGYPGVRAALERLDGLITQHLASKNIPRNKQGN